MNRIYAPPAGGANRKLPLPEGAEQILKTSNEQLQSLEKRYAICGLPMAAHSWWNSKRTSHDLELAWFRGDNAYVWQTRHMGTDPATRYFLYAQDVISRDKHRWLNKLKEDGAFGCWAFEFKTLPVLSRDLLDSINELAFLDEHLNLKDGKIKSILDIGAGYGRLAHRALTALDSIDDYICVDGVATSTFLCDYYLKFRGLEARSSVVPLDQLALLQNKKIDLAINIHSFSEMTYGAIEGWFDILSASRIPYLFIIPNDPDNFLSIETSHQRKDFKSLIHKAGYKQLAERHVIENQDIRDMVGVKDKFYLFELQ